MTLNVLSQTMCRFSHTKFKLKLSNGSELVIFFYGNDSVKKSQLFTSCRNMLDMSTFNAIYSA